MHDKIHVSVTTFMHTVMYTMLDLLFVWFYTLVILLKNASSYGPSVACLRRVEGGGGGAGEDGGGGGEGESEWSTGSVAIPHVL